MGYKYSVDLLPVEKHFLPSVAIVTSRMTVFVGKYIIMLMMGVYPFPKRM